MTRQTYLAARLDGYATFIDEVVMEIQPPLAVKRELQTHLLSHLTGLEEALKAVRSVGTPFFGLMLGKQLTEEELQSIDSTLAAVDQAKYEAQKMHHPYCRSSKVTAHGTSH